MYLQTGDEGQWLQQQQRSMEIEAGRRLAADSTASGSRRDTAKAISREDPGASLGDAVRIAAGRVMRLLRSSLSGSGAEIFTAYGLCRVPPA